jgi:hypothetical protein
MGYEMPNLSGEEVIDHNILVKKDSAPRVLEDKVTAKRFPTPTSDSSTSLDNDQSSRAEYGGEGRTHRPSQAPPPVRRRPSASLIRDTSGHAHFIGPSGGLSFLAELRHLVLARVMKSTHGNTEASANFAHDVTATSLEEDEPQEPTEPDSLELLATSTPQTVQSILANDFPGPGRPDPAGYLQCLPDEPTRQILLQTYFTKVHGDFPLFHRATFEDEFELFMVQPRTGGLSQGASPQPISHTSGPDWGWLGCLHMILLFGSVADCTSNYIDHKTLQRESLSRVRSLLPHLVTKSTITNVQALLLLSLFLHNNNNRNGAWNLLGTAARIAFALGLHRCDLDTAFRPTERELRKQVFCTLYGFEQFLSSSLGRPSGLHEFDFDVKFPRDGILDDSTTASTQLGAASLRLQKILGQTREAIVKLKDKVTQRPYPAHNQTSTTALSSDEEIMELLNRWRQDLPSRLSIESIETVGNIQLPPNISDCTKSVPLNELETSLSRQTPAQLRALITLHIQYHYIALLVTRPTLLWEITSINRRTTSRRSSQDSGNPVHHSAACNASSMATACRYHACQLSALVVLLDRFKILNGVTALDVFYAYSAGLVLILGLLKNPGPAQMHRHGSHEARREEECLDMDEFHDQGNTKALISLLRSTTGTVEKSGTMKRVEAVMNKFADSVIRESSEVRGRRNQQLDQIDQMAAGSYPVSGGFRSQNFALGARHESVDRRPLPEHAIGLRSPINHYGSTTDSDSAPGIDWSQRSLNWSSSGTAFPAVQGTERCPTAGNDGFQSTLRADLLLGPYSSSGRGTGMGGAFQPDRPLGRQHSHQQQYSVVGGGQSNRPCAQFAQNHGMQRTTTASGRFDSSIGPQTHCSTCLGLHADSQGMANLTPLSFWYDSFGQLTDEQILDWADLETFLDTQNTPLHYS